jgi:2'-5' RNA ligase
MQAIVSILDDDHRQQVESICDELAAQFNLTHACGAFSHFTYQLVEEYNDSQIQTALRWLAGETPPFEITTSGLGIFTGKRPVLFIGVARAPQLNAFHDRLWRTINPHVKGDPRPHYRQENWIPHVTLANQDLQHEHLPDLMRLLSKRTFLWKMTVDNLTLVPDITSGRDGWLRIPLAG